MNRYDEPDAGLFLAAAALLFLLAWLLGRSKREL